MKKELNTKIASTKKFVSTHKTKIAVVAGIATGATAALVIKHQIDKDKVLLRLPEPAANQLRNRGGSYIYDTPYGAAMLTMPDNIQLDQE